MSDDENEEEDESIDEEGAPGNSCVNNFGGMLWSRTNDDGPLNN